MAFTRVWNTAYEATPADGVAASGGGNRIRDLKTDLSERLKVDHSWDPANPDATNDGMHEQVTLLEQAGDPANKTSAVRLYTKDVSGVNELFAKDEANNVFQLTAGGTLALVGHDNVWTAQNSMTPFALTSGTTITPDCDNGNNFTLDLSHNATIANPSNIGDGTVITIMIRQDAGGTNTTAWGSKWLFPNGLDTNVAAGANDFSLVSGIYDSGDDVIYANIVKDFV